MQNVLTITKTRKNVFSFLFVFLNKGIMKKKQKKQTGHILLFACIPRVDNSLFISLLILASLFSVAGLLPRNAMVHSVRHSAAG